MAAIPAELQGIDFGRELVLDAISGCLRGDPYGFLKVNQVIFTGGTLEAKYEIYKRSEMGLGIMALMPMRFFVRLSRSDAHPKLQSMKC